MGDSKTNNKLTRKQFIYASALGVVGLCTSSFKPLNLDNIVNRNSVLDETNIVNRTKDIFNLVPKLYMDNGVLIVEDGKEVPQFQTYANKLNQELDYKFVKPPCGITLHTFGESMQFRKRFGGTTVPVPETYMAGFGEATTAPFVVGEGNVPDEINFGILQMEKMTEEGWPYRSAHCMLPDEPDTWYVIQAYYQHLREFDLWNNSNYFNFFGKHAEKPNKRLIGIESIGYGYDSCPPLNKVYANTIGLVCALMEEYDINLANIFGHYELDSNKSDPGKIYLHSIRQLLLGYIGLYGNDNLKKLAFEDSGYGDINRGFTIHDSLFRRVSSQKTIARAEQLWGDFSKTYTTLKRRIEFEKFFESRRGVPGWYYYY